MMLNTNKSIDGDFSMIMYDLDYYKALGPLLARTDIRYLNLQVTEVLTQWQIKTGNPGSTYLNHTFFNNLSYLSLQEHYLQL